MPFVKWSDGEENLNLASVQNNKALFKKSIKLTTIYLTQLQLNHILRQQHMERSHMITLILSTEGRKDQFSQANFQ